MDTARQEGKLKKGNLVLLASVGAGFTVGATLLQQAHLELTSCAGSPLDFSDEGGSTKFSSSVISQKVEQF